MSSSTKTLSILPKPTASFLLAVAILAAVRLLIAANPDRLETVPNGNLDTFVYYQKEFDYRTGNAPSPRVLMIGSSRIQYLLGKNLADALTMPENEVGSYGFAASNLWTYAQFLERNPRLLQRCDVLVLDCMPGSYFYVPYVQGRTRAVFTRYATVPLRWQLPTVSLRMEALGDLVFPLWSYRNNPLGWRVLVHQAGMSQEERYRDYITPGTLTNKATRYRPLPKADDETIKRDVAPPPVHYAPAVDAVRSILAAAPGTCTIIFWIPPLRPDFAEEVPRRPELQESFDAFRIALENLDDPRVRIVWYDDPAATRFPASDFKDPDHFLDSVIQTKLAAEAARVIQTHLERAPSDPS